MKCLYILSDLFPTSVRNNIHISVQYFIRLDNDTTMILNTNIIQSFQYNVTLSSRNLL